MEERETGRDLTRVNAFSDGLFAIAATLLALSIKVPDIPEGELPGQLHTLVGPTLVYFLSFGIVGVYWLRHHELFRHLRSVDDRFMALNLLFLSLVALLPVPTELLGRYGDLTAPTVIYAASMVAVSASLRLLTVYAARAGLFRGEGPVHHTEHGDAVMAMFLLSIPIAFVSPDAAKYSWLGIGVLANILVRRRR